MSAGKFVWLAVTFLIVSLAAITSAQTIDPNQFLTLKDYLSYAEAHNAGLKSSYQQWQAALEQVLQEKALPEPQFNYQYWTRQSDLQMKQTAGLMQMFPWFGKIDARTEAAIKEAQAAQQKYQASRLSLFKEIKEAFYEFAYLARATDIANENLELFKHFEQVALTKHLTEMAGHPDVIRAQIETARMEDVLRGLEQLRPPTLSRLLTALTLPSDMNLPWPNARETNITELDYEKLVTILREKNPELTQLNFESLAAASRIEAAKKNFYPDIGAGVMWEDMDNRGGRDGVALVFQVNIPLWRNSLNAAVKQAHAKKAEIEQQKINTENTLLTQASKAYYEFRDSVRKIHLYRDILIPKGTELLRSSEAAYRSGAIDFLSLIDAQRTLLDYRLSYRRALADNQQKVAELEMLTGTELNLNNQKF